MDNGKGSTTLQCENCSKCGRETFHKAFELKKTGLKIFKYKCWESSQAECLGHQPLTKKEYIILDNPNNKELRRPDFIKELCQYKTKCMCCRILIKRVLGLLDAIDEIKKREVIGVCEYCKRSSKITCKKCKYLIKKYVEERKALEQESLFRQWLEELEHVLEPLSGDDEYSDIIGQSAARSSRTRESHRLGKYIPKEFRYPPTTREFFPDYGSPFVTQYPQPSETLSPPQFPVSSSQLHEISKNIKKKEKKHKSLKQQASFDKSDRRFTITHQPLMRGPSEFPYIELKRYRHDDLKIFGSLKKERYKSGTQSEHTEPSEISTISGLGVNKLPYQENLGRYKDVDKPQSGDLTKKQRHILRDKISQELALPRDRRLLPDDKLDIQTTVKNKGPYLADDYSRSSMQQALKRNRGLVSKITESVANSKNVPVTYAKVYKDRQNLPDMYSIVTSPTALDGTSKGQPLTQQYQRKLLESHFNSTKDRQKLPDKYAKTDPLDPVSKRQATTQHQDIKLPESNFKGTKDRRNLPDKYAEMNAPILLDKISQRQAQTQQQEIKLPESQSKATKDRKKIPDSYSKVVSPTLLDKISQRQAQTQQQEFKLPESQSKATKDRKKKPDKYAEMNSPILLDKVSQRQAQTQQQEIKLPESQSKATKDRKKLPDSYSKVDSPTLIDKISQTPAQTQHDINLPDRRSNPTKDRQIFSDKNEQVNSSTLLDVTPQKQLPLQKQQPKINASPDDHPDDTFDKVATKIAPSTKSSRGPDTNISETVSRQKEYRDKLLQKFSHPLPASKQRRNSPDGSPKNNKTDKPNVQDKAPRSHSLRSTKKQEQQRSPNKLPATHPFNKTERRKVNGPSVSYFNPQSEGIINKTNMKLLRGDTEQVQSNRKKFLDGITELLQKQTSPGKPDFPISLVEKTLKPRFPGTNQTKLQKEGLDSLKPMSKNTKKGKISPHEIGITEIKSIMAKKRNKIDKTDKSVVVKVDKETHIKESKNLHKLDVKLEKLIYNAFIKRMHKIKEIKLKQQKSLREKRKQQKGTINEYGDMHETLEISPKETDAESKSFFDIEFDLEEQEEEEDFFIFSPVMSAQQIESDLDLAPVECAAEKKPNVKIVGNRIVRLKPNEVSEVPVFESASLHSEESKVNFNPPMLFWENPISEFGTPVLDARIFQYELSNPTWITNGWTILPKQVTVKEICLYDMVPLERNWFLLHKNQDLFYKTGERLATIDEEGNGRVFYKNGKVAMVYNCNKEMNPERLVVFSSGEGAYKLAASKPIRKLAVFDHLGSGIIYDAGGRPRLKYNQYEGQKFDSDIKGVQQWKFHSLNRKKILKTKYKEIIENIRNESLESFEMSNQKKDKRVVSPESKEEKDAILAIERDNRKNCYETKTYNLFTCELGPIRINKHFVLKILNQRSIKLHFQDAAGVVVNLGMRMLSTSLIGFLLGKETEVVTPMDDKINVHFL